MRGWEKEGSWSKGEKDIIDDSRKIKELTEIKKCKIEKGQGNWDNIYEA